MTFHANIESQPRVGRTGLRARPFFVTFFRFSWLWLTAVTLLCMSVQAQAHPLGNFSVNRYSRLQLNRQYVRIFYIMDMAEIPAFQAIDRMDTDSDGAISSSEQSKYEKATADDLRRGLELMVNGNKQELRPISSKLTMPPGQAGLSTLRWELVLESVLPDAQVGPNWQVTYKDHNHANRLGWKEIVVEPMGQVQLLDSDVSQKDRSDELRNYPADLLTDPLNIQQASLTFTPNPFATSNAESIQPVATSPNKPQNRLTALIATKTLTLPIMLFALLSAAVLGAFHALSPGHGKTLVGAYLVGTRGTARHALILGLTVTMTHTIGVFALGLITLGASHFLMPEQIYPWLGVISGAIVVVMGANLFRQRMQGKARHVDSHNADTQNQGHYHHPGHDHPHSHGHSHHHNHTDGRPTLRNLLALGISGGLLPCPSALVVLLGAIALQRVGFGLLLIVAFSIGLAAVLTIVGLLFVSARSLFSRSGRSRLILRYVPIGSALIITLAGIGISIQGLRQIM